MAQQQGDDHDTFTASRGSSGDLLGHDERFGSSGIRGHGGGNKSAQSPKGQSYGKIGNSYPHNGVSKGNHSYPRGYYRWSYRYWDYRFGCELCYSTDDGCYYYFYAPANCYYPFSYIQQYPPVAAPNGNFGPGMPMPPNGNGMQNGPPAGPGSAQPPVP